MTDKNSTKKQADSNSKKDDSKKKTSPKQKGQREQTKKKQGAKQSSYLADDSSLQIIIPWQEAKKTFHKVLNNQTKNLKIKGFRKGKAPASIAEEEIGLPKLYNLTLQRLLPDYYRQAIEEGDYQPITEPEFKIISVNKDNDWKIKAFFAQKPEIKLGQYQQIVKKAKKKAQENITQAQKASKKQAQSQAKDKKNKKEAEQEKKKQEDKKEATDSKSKTKETESEKQQAALTDKQKKDITLQTIFNFLIKEIEPKIPQILVKQNTQRELANLQNRLDKLNVKLEDYLQSQDMSQQELTSRLAYSSLNQLQVEFLLQAIAEKEELEVKEEKIKERIEEVEDEEVRNKMEQDQHYRNYLRSVLLKQKVMDFLLEI